MAAAMLLKVDAFTGPTPYAARPGCQPIRYSGNSAGTALQQWSYHCADGNQAVRTESFYYVFDLEHPRPLRLRVDVRTESHTAATPEELEAALTSRLTARYGPGDRQPELYEIGFSRIKHSEPVNGLHWRTGRRHIFLHRNPSHSQPLGNRTGVQLIVLDQRLLDERVLDERISALAGLPIGQLPQAQRRQWTPQQLLAEVQARVATLNTGDNQTRAQALVDLDRLIVEANGCLVIERSGEMAREHPLAARIRQALAPHGARLGGLGHYGGMMYDQDLLGRAWRLYPDTSAGELAFLTLQRLGWAAGSVSPRSGGSDRFRVVIWRGEAFLSERPHSPIRKDVLFTLAVAYESWWSIGMLPPDDPLFELGSPLPSRQRENRRRAPEARLKAIAYYEELIRLAPASEEALAARRQLPRLKLGLDTGCRQYFSTEC